jgi:hypothetical protein
MQTKIESFSDLKTNEFGTSAKVLLGNGEQVYINEDPAKLVGKTVDIEITKKNSKAGREYKIGKIAKVYEATATASNGNGNGKITWDAYRALAEAAHGLAMKLEPDDETERVDRDGGRVQAMVDRSTARAAILNTVMIAYSNGKIVVPEDDDDQIPPF